MDLFITPQSDGICKTDVIVVSVGNSYYVYLAAGVWICLSRLSPTVFTKLMCAFKAKLGSAGVSFYVLKKLLLRKVTLLQSFPTLRLRKAKFNSERLTPLL